MGSWNPIAAETLRQYDVGTNLELDLVDDKIPFDLAGHTVELMFQPPGAGPFSKPATIPSAAKVRYKTEPGMLAWIGLWRVQAHVTGMGDDWRSRERLFEVERIIGPVPIFLTMGAAGVHASAPHVLV